MTRRRLLLPLAGLLVAAATAAGCTEPAPVPPPPPASADPALLRDDVIDGVVVADRGFSVFPDPGADETKRIVGAAAVFRNDTDQPKRVHIRYQFVDAAGRGWRSAEDPNNWQSVISAGWAFLPPGRTVELGDSVQVAVADADRLAGIVMLVIEDSLPPRRNVLLTPRVDDLRFRSAPDGWDYVSFEVDNGGGTFIEPDYSLVYRSPEGRLIGGMFVTREHWVDIGKSLPPGETDQYRPGRSRHTLPAWLPAGTTVADVTLHLWPS